jgi:hypothetical protein
MERQPVSSTIVASIGYDKASAMLEVEFVSGAVYQYFEVPAQVYLEVVSGESIGKAMTSAVIGRFRFARLNS